nr:MAG TPA: hypothetical protein [Caudoviricetes sp.]
MGVVSSLLPSPPDQEWWPSLQGKEDHPRKGQK